MSLKGKNIRFYVKQDIDAACTKKRSCMHIQMGLNGCASSISARNFLVAVHFVNVMCRGKNVWKRLPSTKSKNEPKSDKTRKKNMEN